jgi:hypothetical protein
MMYKVITDCSTNETVTIPLTDQEIAAWEVRKAQAEAEAAEREAALAAEEAARESARSKLAALGLTWAEVAALVK